MPTDKTCKKEKLKHCPLLRWPVSINIKPMITKFWFLLN